MTDKASEGGRDLDLEKELSCSICTDVLYRPLTLLDCLHSFCGSCLKEWFAWQSSSKSHVYSCPACRAVVRDTRPNATLSTLLDMFLQAHPDKGKTAQEKLDMDKTYKPGDDVIPQVDLGQVSDDDEDEEEHQMLAQARELSLNDVGLGNRSTPAEHQRHTRQNRRRDDSPRSAQVDALSHQSSIRSLLSQSDMDLGDMEDEIMRHIIDHGLLDGHIVLAAVKIAVIVIIIVTALLLVPLHEHLHIVILLTPHHTGNLLQPQPIGILLQTHPIDILLQIHPIVGLLQLPRHLASMPWPLSRVNPHQPDAVLLQPITLVESIHQPIGTAI
ncbi:hypothetical protein KCU85_g1017, partial [Aureobasidium melanogenum]